MLQGLHYNIDGYIFKENISWFSSRSSLQIPGHSIWNQVTAWIHSILLHTFVIRSHITLHFPSGERVGRLVSL